MKNFEIGGHSDMSLEEVQEYQQEGGELAEELRDEFPPDEETHDSLIENEERLEQEIMGEREPGAELSHQEFIDEQTAFEEELMGEREPGAELSHQEFIDAQDKFEEEIMNSDNSDPSYEEIVNTPDVEDDAYRAEDEDFVKAWNTGAVEAVGSQIDGLDTEGLADSINDNPEIIESEIDFGYGTAEAMHDMEGGGVTATDLFIAESDSLASTSTDIGDSSGGVADSSDE
jgi:hypothetical protein